MISQKFHMKMQLLKINAQQVIYYGTVWYIKMKNEFYLKSWRTWKSKMAANNPRWLPKVLFALEKSFLWNCTFTLFLQSLNFTRNNPGNVLHSHSSHSSQFIQFTVHTVHTVDSWSLGPGAWTSNHTISALLYLYSLFHQGPTLGANLW